MDTSEFPQTRREEIAAEQERRRLADLEPITGQNATRVRHAVRLAWSVISMPSGSPSRDLREIEQALRDASIICG